MLTASMLTPMYSSEPGRTLGVSSTSRHFRGRLPSRLTVWLHVWKRREVNTQWQSFAHRSSSALQKRRPVINLRECEDPAIQVFPERLKLLTPLKGNNLKCFLGS